MSVQTIEGSEMFTQVFALAMVRAAFTHGYYAGHADSRTRMSEQAVESRADKYMAVEPLPAMLAAANKGRCAMSGYTSLETAARVVYEGITAVDDVPGIEVNPRPPLWHELDDADRSFWMRLMRDAVLPDGLTDVEADDAMEAEPNGTDRITLSPAVTS